MRSLEGKGRRLKKIFGEISLAKGWKKIPVFGGKEAKVDAEDYERVMEHAWHTVTARSGRETITTSIKMENGWRQISLGKFLMKPKPGKYVYPRRFQNGFDYRKENLIVCTMQERQQILPKSRKHGSSQFKGVSFWAARNRWQAGIQVEGRSINLGLYLTEIEAAEAYNRAARKYFGEHAYQNPTKSAAARRLSDERKGAPQSKTKKTKAKSKT